MPPLPLGLPGSSAQMVWQHLPVQFQKQKCKGWARWDREISVQERALGGCHYEWFLQQSLRINLTSVLIQVSGKQTIWDAIWLGVLSETMPVREGRRQEGAERGAELSCSLNKEFSHFLWGFFWAAGPCRVSVLWSRESVLYIHTGPDLVLGLPLERENQVSQVTLVVKNMPANAGDIRGAGSTPGLGRSPGGGHGNPLQYCHLENPIGRGIWWATVHKVTESRTQMSSLSCMHRGRINLGEEGGSWQRT